MRVGIGDPRWVRPDITITIAQTPWSAIANVGARVRGSSQPTR
jgi:hypothetical protein